MATRDSNDDHERSRLVCKPWDGSRSAEFRAAFMRDFSLGADAKYGHAEETGFFRVVETALVLETAVLETHGFPNTPS